MTESATPKKYLVSWDQFHRDCRALAWRLSEERAEEWKGIIAITRGGMIPAGIIARELDIRLVETVGVSSYDDKTQRAASITKQFNTAITGTGKDWLIIDELVDTGKTARIVRDLLPDAHFAAVYAKPEGKPLVDTYITLVSQDTWIYFPWDIDFQPNEPIAIQRKQGGLKP